MGIRNLPTIPEAIEEAKPSRKHKFTSSKHTSPRPNRKRRKLENPDLRRLFYSPPKEPSGHVQLKLTSDVSRISGTEKTVDTTWSYRGACAHAAQTEETCSDKATWRHETDEVVCNCSTFKLNKMATEIDSDDITLKTAPTDKSRNEDQLTPMENSSSGNVNDESRVEVPQCEISVNWQLEHQQICSDCKPFAKENNCEQVPFSSGWRILFVLKFQCEACDEIFPDKYQLMHHLQFHQNEKLDDLAAVEIQACEIAANWMQEHQIRCSFCKLAAEKNRKNSSSPCHRILLPVSLWRTLIVFEYQCEVCLKSFLDKENLMDHISLHENAAKTLVDQDKAEAELSHEGASGVHVLPVGKGKQSFKCPNPKCGKVFGRKGHLKRHMLQIHNGMKLHQCHECSEIFGCSDTLKAHIRMHEEIKPFSCTECSDSFSRKQSLDSHLRTIHKAKFGLKCPNCEKCFGQKRYLRAHILMVHERKKHYQCPKCKKQFENKVELKDHRIAVHDKKRPFQCPECQFCFTKKDSLAVHVLLVHQKKRPHQCPKCPKTYGRKSGLNLHILTVHEGKSPHQCSKCEKRFGQRGNLYVHIRRAHGTHQCPECSKSFGHKRILAKHLKNHKTEQALLLVDEEAS